MARADTVPCSTDSPMYSLRIAGTGMREPHWHPVTESSATCARARAHDRAARRRLGRRQRARSPRRLLHPRGFPPHIENLEDTETHFLVFFDQAEVRDIGFTGSAGAYPRRILAPTLGMAAADLPQLPPMPEDLLIVDKRNPLD